MQQPIESKEGKQVNYDILPMEHLEFAGMVALISAEILAWAWWRGFWP
jgi:hypothetical protein